MANRQANPYYWYTDKHGLPLQTKPTVLPVGGRYMTKEQFLKEHLGDKSDWQQMLDDTKARLQFPSGETPMSRLEGGGVDPSGYLRGDYAPVEQASLGGYPQYAGPGVPADYDAEMRRQLERRGLQPGAAGARIDAEAAAAALQQAAPQMGYPGVGQPLAPGGPPQSKYVGYGGVSVAPDTPVNPTGAWTPAAGQNITPLIDPQTLALLSQRAGASAPAVGNVTGNLAQDRARGLAMLAALSGNKTGTPYYNPLSSAYQPPGGPSIASVGRDVAGGISSAATRARDAAFAASDGANALLAQAGQGIGNVASAAGRGFGSLFTSNLEDALPGGSPALTALPSGNGGVPASAPVSPMGYGIPTPLYTPRNNYASVADQQRLAALNADYPGGSGNVGNMAEGAPVQKVYTDSLLSPASSDGFGGPPTDTVPYSPVRPDAQQASSLSGGPVRIATSSVGPDPLLAQQGNAVDAATRGAGGYGGYDPLSSAYQPQGATLPAAGDMPATGPDGSLSVDDTGISNRPGVQQPHPETGPLGAVKLGIDRPLSGGRRLAVSAAAAAANSMVPGLGILINAIGRTMARGTLDNAHPYTGGPVTPYTRTGTTDWGSAVYGAPYGATGYSNSMFTPTASGWNAPNFNSVSGGPTYAYNPLTHTYIDSRGNEHPYE